MNKIDKDKLIKPKTKRTKRNNKIVNKENVFLEDFKIGCYTSVSELDYNTIKGIEVSGNTVTGLKGDKFIQRRLRDIELDKFVVEYGSYGEVDLSSIIDSLSDGAFRLYDYMKKNTAKKKLYVFVDKYAYMEKMKITSLTTWLKYEGELLRYGLFARIENQGGWYWINPRYYYSGFRITDLEEYKKNYEKKPKIEDKQNANKSNK